MNKPCVDILIAGGGLVGLCLACLLREQASPWQVAVLEPRPPQPPGDDIGLRVSALSPASQSVLERTGAWQALPENRVSAYRSMCVWRDGGPQGPQSIHFDAAEQGLRALGHIVENEVLRWALWQRALALEVTLLADSALAVAQRERDAMLLRLEDGSEWRARLVVGADGAASRLRDAMGLTVHRRGYGQQGLVTHVASEAPHRETAWQRFLADGPVALLPLSDGRCSVVWSCPDAFAESLLSRDRDALSETLSAATERVLGRLQVTETPRAFPLAVAHVPRYAGERYVLVGDAAHQVHPLAGQGVNLGLADAAELAAQLAGLVSRRCADPGDARVLRRYERARKADNLLTMGTMDLFHRVFAGGHPVLASAAGLGLGLVDRAGPLKHRLARQALGHSGLVQ